MSKRNAEGAARRIQTVLGWLFFGITGLAIGVAIWLRLTPKPENPSDNHLPPAEVIITIPYVKDGEISYTQRTLHVPANKNAYDVAFQTLLREAPQFPKRARLLSAVREDNTLILNFSKELQEDFEGGSDNEAAVINAITRTAGTFPEIRQVQILIAGNKIEALADHIEISEPLPVER
jgi:spore germination protein GerM